MIKIIRGLDITALGVCVYNRKWQPVHLQQGDMDGACAVYSIMMNLTNLNTSFKGNTSKGRLFKEFFVTQGLCRGGFYFSEIKEKLSHSFAKEVMSSVRQYATSVSDQASYVEELKIAIDDNLPLVTAITFRGGAHAILAIGYEEQEGVIRKIFCLDPGYTISQTSLWNSVITLNERKGMYCHQYITDNDDKNVFVSETLKIERK